MRLRPLKADIRNAQDMVMLDVWTTYHNFTTSQQVYETAKILLRSAQESEELALGRYKVGKGTLNDTLDAQASLASARSQWVQARYNVLLSRFDLLRAIGSKTWKQDLGPVLTNNIDTKKCSKRNYSGKHPCSTFTCYTNKYS